MSNRTVFITRASAFVAVSVALIASPAHAKVLLSGIYFDAVLTGNPEPDSAVRLINTDERRAAKVGGFALTERVTPRPSTRNAHPVEDGGATKERIVRLPDGATIPAGGEIWIAATARGFREVFGESPAFEARDGWS